MMTRRDADQVERTREQTLRRIALIDARYSGDADAAAAAAAAAAAGAPAGDEEDADADGDFGAAAAPEDVVGADVAAVAAAAAAGDGAGAEYPAATTAVTGCAGGAIVPAVPGDGAAADVVATLVLSAEAGGCAGAAAGAGCVEAAASATADTAADDVASASAAMPAEAAAAAPAAASAMGSASEFVIPPAPAKLLAPRDSAARGELIRLLEMLAVPVSSCAPGAVGAHTLTAHAAGGGQATHGVPDGAHSTAHTVGMRGALWPRRTVAGRVGVPYHVCARTRDCRCCLTPSTGVGQC
jgi:hypothetical protein